MGKCERCGVDLHEDEYRGPFEDEGWQKLHTPERCRDRLKTQRDEALAREAKLESSVSTQVVARPFLDGYWNASPRESARTWSMHCRHFTGGDCFLTGMDTCESLTCSVCGQVWRRPVHDITLDERDKLHDENAALRAERDQALARAEKAELAVKNAESFIQANSERADGWQKCASALRAELARKTEALEQMDRRIDRPWYANDTLLLELLQTIRAALAEPKAGGEPERITVAEFLDEVGDGARIAFALADEKQVPVHVVEEGGRTRLIINPCTRDDAPDPEAAAGGGIAGSLASSHVTSMSSAPNSFEARAREYFNDHSPSQFQRLIDDHRKTWNEAVEAVMQAMRDESQILSDDDSAVRGLLLSAAASCRTGGPK